MNHREFLCDVCGKTTDLDDKFVEAMPRPSDPHEIVATMWYCPDCHAEGWGRSVEDVKKAYPESEGYSFNL